MNIIAGEESDAALTEIVGADDEFSGGSPGLRDINCHPHEVRGATNVSAFGGVATEFFRHDDGKFAVGHSKRIEVFSIFDSVKWHLSCVSMESIGLDANPD